MPLVLVLQGLVHCSHEGPTVETDGSTQPIDLTPFAGQEVVFMACHFPREPIQARWGLGSCYWTPVGTCPAGHHLDPELMCSWAGEGKLVPHGPNWWAVETSGGFPPLNQLEGHNCKLAMCVKSPKVRDEQHVSLDIEGLKQTMQSLKDIQGDLIAMLDRARK